MKNKLLASVVMMVFMSSLLTGVLCFCVSGDCRTSSRIAADNVPSCHHAPASRSQSTVPKDCCGKCQIEKAAVPSVRLAAAPQGVSAAFTVKTVEQHEERAPDVPGYRDWHGPPSSFFVQYTLGATFSYSAPPLG